MSVWKNLPNGKTVRRNIIPPDKQWSWWTIEMLESPAYRVLSLSAHRVIARIRIELAGHGGKDNGKLPVTFQNFMDYGIHRKGIAPAIREAAALGFIRITRPGRAGNAEFRTATLYALTHLPTDDQPAATNDWQRIETIEEAEANAEAARKAKKRGAKKYFTRPVKGTDTRPVKGTDRPDFSGPKNGPTPGPQSRPRSISRRRRRSCLLMAQGRLVLP
jgi:hypothetical protein